MKTETTYYQIEWEGLTYDHDYGQRIKLKIWFSSLDTLKTFRSGFPHWAKEFGLIEEFHDSVPPKQHISFRDLEEFVDENPNKFPKNCYTEALGYYDTGWFVPDPKAEILKITTIHETVNESPSI